MYSVLNSKKYLLSHLELIPICKQDMEKIRIWRNQQRNILRQNKIVTKKEQENYFNSIIKPGFKQKHPEMILFSILEHGECVGYGGLVHIDWNSKRAEISFLTDPKRTKLNSEFQKDFKIFLEIILNIGFNEFSLNKLTTETFTFRKNIIHILERIGFVNEAILKDHVRKNNQYYNSLLHCIFKEEFNKN